jgi:hypothetical protein
MVGLPIELGWGNMYGLHYLLSQLCRTERIETVVTERSAAEIQIKLEAKLQQYLLSEAG